MESIVSPVSASCKFEHTDEDRCQTFKLDITGEVSLGSSEVDGIKVTCHEICTPYGAHVVEQRLQGHDAKQVGEWFKEEVLGADDHTVLGQVEAKLIADASTPAEW